MADMRAKGRSFDQRDPARHRAAVQRGGATAGRMGRGKPKPVKDGKSHYAQKLNEELVAQMRLEREHHGTAYAALGKKYGVSANTAHGICTGRYWKHVV